MKKNKKTKNEKKELKERKKEMEKKIPNGLKWQVESEIKKSIMGIVCLGLAILVILSFFKLAGPFGFFLYDSFYFLFGWVYFLLPVSLIIAGLIFLTGSLRKNIYLSTFVGLLLSIIGVLGISDLIKPLSTGFLGKQIGYLENVFGFWGGIVFCLIIFLIGLVIVFGWSLKFKKEKKEDKLTDNIIEPIKEIKIKDNEEEKKSETKNIKNIVKENLNQNEKNKNDFLFNKNIITNWNFPPLNLLESESGKPTSGDIKASANIIKRTLANFGIPVEMGEVFVGPTVTRYTLKPAEGVKLSRIVALQNDLSLALAAHPIRIEAPIPGQSLVGIEIPNKQKLIVRLQNLLNNNKFLESDLLTFPLGRDVSGSPVYVDLAKMPHLLVAGSTGSGKSITIHSLICSLLYKNTPETLKFILIDPKRVELSAYNKLPHLISETITNPKKTISALRWAVNEMDERYNELLANNVRDISTYNQKMMKEKKPLMPYIVIVIDELADLMVAFGREIEAAIVRLAQMARATGIHLIVSTQRPSVEVVTGLIKANITSRIALQVASQVDSRTILDMAGAERLLGRGDMLYLSGDTSKPIRIQGIFISEGEVQKIVKYIVEHNKDYEFNDEEQLDFDKALEKQMEEISLNNNYADSLEMDELYPEAYKVVVTTQKASASFLQRRLRVGYARAARLLDLLEEHGVIGPGDGAKPREVLIKTNASQLESSESLENFEEGFETEDELENEE
ncbi:MAG TPA: DNA translocase FtsK 4TM domain-containing protein [Candidatus Paceibacterota bacterium]|nr:DNA translocase FtsK 4TM domain-containing protein [Candidatus Paceibacterota bacterium]HRU36043.1 DNA translocase FtsK 4TM domain-containing protein [Candidatus Paceibacterota bacterium]